MKKMIILWLFSVLLCLHGCVPPGAGAEDLLLENIANPSDEAFLEKLESQLYVIKGFKEAEYKYASFEYNKARCILEKKEYTSFSEERRKEEANHIIALYSACLKLEEFIETSAMRFDLMKFIYEMEREDFVIPVLMKNDLDGHHKVFDEFLDYGYLYVVLAHPLIWDEFDTGLSELCKKLNVFRPETPVFDDLESVLIGKIRPQFTEKTGRIIQYDDLRYSVNYTTFSYDKILGFYDELYGHEYEMFFLRNDDDGWTVYHNYLTTKRKAEKRIFDYNNWRGKRDKLPMVEQLIFDSTEEWLHEAAENSMSASEEEIEQKAVEIGVERIREALVHCYAPIKMITKNPDIIKEFTTMCSEERYNHREGELHFF